jgi:hypothetical protein
MPISVSLLMPAYFLGLVIFRDRLESNGLRLSFAFVMIVTLAFTAASYFTGVEDREYAMASADLLDQHYDLGFYFCFVFGSISLICLAQALSERLRTKKIDLLLFIASVAVCVLIYFVGHTGAEITYGE